MNIVYTYTKEQAIEDGVLMRIADYYEQQEGAYVLQDLFESVQKKSPRRFSLGETLITANAAQQIPPIESLIAIGRHLRGDWGEVDADDRASNEHALATEGRIFSVYRVREGTKFYVITEADRSATTVLMPADY